MNMAVLAAACYDNILEVHLSQDSYDNFSKGIFLRGMSIDQGHVSLDLAARDGGHKFEKTFRGGQVVYKWRHFFSGLSPRPENIPTFGMTKVHHSSENDGAIQVVMPMNLKPKRELARNKKGNGNGSQDQIESEDAFPLESELRFAKQIINQAKAAFGEDMRIELNADGSIAIDITIRRRI